MELAEKKSYWVENFDPDNPTPEMFHHCQTYSKRILNPIYDWTTEEVWEFIKQYKVPYCELYDCGFKRLGCIGCPMSGEKGMTREFERYPKYKEAYIRAFRNIIKNIKAKGTHTTFTTAEEVFDRWIKGRLGELFQGESD